MRARLLLKLVGTVVFLILTAMTARACTGSSSPSSPINPVNVARNGIAGACADQAAAAQAAGSDRNADHRHLGR